MAHADSPDTMFRPPLATGMKVLDRSFFQKTIPLKAARIFNNKQISVIRSQLQDSKDVLQEDRVANVVPDPDESLAKIGRKCLLLRPESRSISKSNGVNNEANAANGFHFRDTNVHWPHSSVIDQLVHEGLISVIPYHLQLDYKYWLYHDIISAIVSTLDQSEVPSGFSQVGHVAHLNLREQYLPYKYLIAEILLDKNPSVRTVINKIDDVGEENEYRTFRYEVLAGPDDLNVIVSESNCTFSFDYSKVYWNSRLHTEHARLVELFQPGEAICDVMAGIGPFAVPAGKKGCFVWANDLNPDSVSSLEHAIAANKVGSFVRPYNNDGAEFIRESAYQIMLDDRSVDVKTKLTRTERNAGKKEVVTRRILQPKSFQHYVLNLPASAVTFLSNFVGLYSNKMRASLPAETKMPLIHVYTFSTKDELNATSTAEEDNAVQEINGTSTSEHRSSIEESTGAVEKICAAISEQLGFKMRPGSIDEEGGVEIHDVRDVAPKKRMFCATFRLPEAVAVRERTSR